MAYQGLIQDLEGHALKVVFPFGGTVHEVLLPPVFDEEHPLKFPHRPDSEEAGIRLREEAGTVLQCLTWHGRRWSSSALWPLLALWAACAWTCLPSCRSCTALLST
jgi:hypothetical protein